MILLNMLVKHFSPKTEAAHRLFSFATTRWRFWPKNNPSIDTRTGRQRSILFASFYQSRGPERRAAYRFIP